MARQQGICLPFRSTEEFAPVFYLYCWGSDGALSKLCLVGPGPNQHDRQGEPKLTLDPLEKHIQR
jgi:hypothetical protein